MDLYSKILSKWNEFVYLKNPIMFGETKIDMDGYTKLLKDTYDLIGEYKDIFKSGQIEEREVFEYTNLVTSMARYITDESFVEQSENFIFTVTCMLARALVDYANDNVFWTSSDDEDMDWSNKIQYVPYIGEQDPIVYDVNECDYSEFTESARDFYLNHF